MELELELVLSALAEVAFTWHLPVGIPIMKNLPRSDRGSESWVSPCWSSNGRRLLVLYLGVSKEASVPWFLQWPIGSTVSTVRGVQIASTCEPTA